MKNVKIITLGCYKNLVDSERLMRQFQLQGVRLLPEDEQKEFIDLIAINTCGFIHDAKEESINTILSVVQEKTLGKVGKILVFGCLSERYRKELENEIPEVDAYFGKFDIENILKFVVKPVDYQTLHQRVVTTPAHYSYLKISEGCNRKCAFCAIPKITGKHQSNSIEQLIKEATFLSKQGVKELILVAQDLNQYGSDLRPKENLYTLIEKLSDIEGIEWIRLQYLYPKGFPAKLPLLIARNKKVCHYVDIPFQHASNRILERMNRQHTIEDNWRIINSLRDAVPDITLRTTMIVGFPGETTRDFEVLMKFVEEAQFDRLGAFTYSHEENTPAAKHFSDNISKSNKQKRLDLLMQLQESISLTKNQQKIGTLQKVLIDRKEGDLWVGRTQYDSPEVDNEITVYNPQNAAIKIGDFVQVRISGALPFDLEGEIV
ncbi:MAG TPA: 30S ribosomal protein S12 methylthiotransferase RimO [Salinivirgaceae bacterium]|nr:30S ribosomal protein S12 methylthiotransferase RimO [Salinivirgaceae bacterium]